MPTGPIIQFTFDNIELNCSMQVGDTAWVVSTTADPTTLGVTAAPIPDKGQKLGKITNISSNSVTVQLLSTPNLPYDWNFYYFYFTKPIEVNETSLKGYYADVTFENSSKTYAELFSISSEIALSSK